jgi:hypothetical protein
MQKQLLLLISLLMVILGTIGAASAFNNISVDTKYTDLDKNPVKDVNVGDHFVENTTITNTGNKDILDVSTHFTYDETANLTWVKGSLSAGTFKLNPDGTVTWTIANLKAGTSEYIWDEYIARSLGVVNITADVFNGNIYDGSDSAQLNIVESPEPNPVPNSVSINAQTVEMQTTGVPLIPFAVAMGALLGGYGLSRRK